MDRDFLLIRRMKRGDEAAMESFVRLYYPLILRYCQYHIGDSGYAEDLAQDTFERFFRALSGYEHRGKAANFLYVIAGNLCKDFYRRNKELAITEWNSLSGKNEIERVNDKLDMEAALHRLPEELKEVIILHYFQGLKLREIAEILNISLPLVKYRIKKAKEQLITYL